MTPILILAVLFNAWADYALDHGRPVAGICYALAEYALLGYALILAFR